MDCFSSQKILLGTSKTSKQAKTQTKFKKMKKIIQDKPNRQVWLRRKSWAMYSKMKTAKNLARITFKLKVRQETSKSILRLSIWHT